MTNAAEFEHELMGEWDGVEREDIPAAVTGLALELRENVADETPRRRGVGAATWMAAPQQTKPLKDPRAEPGGHAASKAALAGWKIGDQLFVFSNAFYLYFLERGTLHIPGRHFLQGALLDMNDREVRL